MKKLDIVTTCILRDLPTLEFVLDRIHQMLPVKSVHVYVPSDAYDAFTDTLDDKAVVHNEDDVVPGGMTYRDLAVFPHPAFPHMTGWFIQQFLKFSYAFKDTDDDYYLIWDADTVPLQPLEFFDEENRMLIVPAEEHNPPYFETYQKLLSEDPQRKFSFIAQHLIVQKSVLREMLLCITQRQNMQPEEWAWAIVKGMADTGYNIFSEYETYGHYLKNHYPERMKIRPLPWLREGTEVYGFPPAGSVLEKLAEQYAYVSFESKKTRWKKLRFFLFRLAARMGLKKGNV